jgi:hypothetical protein
LALQTTEVTILVTAVTISPARETIADQKLASSLPLVMAP